VRPPPTHVVFDLGGVLIDWNPRHLYRDLIPDDAEREHFLSEVCGPDWNVLQDAGRTIAEANADAIARHPDKRDLIEAYYDRFDAMMKDAIHGTVAVLEELHAGGVPLYALTNWSAETFHHGERRFAFLECFDGILVSGREGLRKPDPAIFHLLCARYALEPAACVFIDDSAANAESAAALGFHAHHFTEPEKLRAELLGYRLLPG
jgi:2-haloacid dehalogenase